MKNLLTEEEINQIRKFNDNKVMVEAIKKVLLYNIYSEGGVKDMDFTKNFALQKALMAIQVNPQISDKELGESLRADTQALRILDLALQQLAKFSEILDIKKEESNPAR